MNQGNRWHERPINRKTFLGGLFALLMSFGPIGRSIAATKALVAKIQGTPNSNSATLAITASLDLKCVVEYGYSSGKFSFKTNTISIKKNSTAEITLKELTANTKVFYRFRYLLANSKSYLLQTGGSFTTAKVETSATFAVQADPHMDENSDANVYKKTLEQVVLASPAFLMDLGDIFMVDKLKDKTEANIRARFELMKDFYKILGNIPLKITLGNHDGELGYSKFNTKNYRKEYFPEQTGELAYFSFTGPDQLHVVLDPFTYTVENPKVDGWQWTLGRTQYDWLKKTLEESSATHKFIYIHHLLVGDAQSRGGVEIAKFNEWGGLNKDGTEGFGTQRPGWDSPIHQLLLKNKVGFVFKGHDHLYVRQELDGIIYQTLPQPSHPGEKLDIKQYGYLSGKAVGGSGFLKVQTSGKVATVDFIKFDGSIGDSYTRTAS